MNQDKKCKFYTSFYYTAIVYYTVKRSPKSTVHTKTVVIRVKRSQCNDKGFMDLWLGQLELIQETGKKLDFNTRFCHLKRKEKFFARQAAVTQVK